MKTKKITALIVSSLLISGLVMGCGKKADTSSTATKENDKNVVVTLGCWGSSPAETKLLDDQIQDFQNENPSITIKKQVITGDFNQVMQTKIASKTEPDVYYLDVSNASSYMEKGVLEPLDKYLDKEDLKDFEPNLLAGFQKDSKTYGLPKDYNTLGLFYNKEMLDKAGVQVPTTWAELEEAAKKLTVDKTKGLSMANDAARFVPFIYQAGGKINDGDKVAFNTPEAAKGLDFYYSLIKKGYAATPKDMGEGWQGDALAHKKAAMVIEGGWMIPFMKESAPDVKYSIAKLPKGDKDGDLAFTVSYVMSKNSKNKEASAKVLTYLTGKKAQQKVAESGLAIPSRKSMNTVYAEKHPEAKALVDMTAASQVYDFGVNGSKIIDQLAKAGEKIQLGKDADAKTALTEAEAALK